MAAGMILASRSPRRLDILRQHGIEPVVLPQDADETLPDGISPEEAVIQLALVKARACRRAIDKEQFSDYYIIGSDTLVYKDEIMGKPLNREDAFRMLSSIRNCEHYVTTGGAVINVSSGEENALSAVTKVYCKDYSDDDIYKYIDEEQPFDKAGAYAIQGPFVKYIDHIEGDYDNVVGLPFRLVEELLEKL